MDKIIKVNFEEWQDVAHVDEGLVAWNYGQILQVEGLTLPDGNVEVHFSLPDREGDASVYIGAVKDNIITVYIPNFIFQKENVFQSTYDAYSFIYQTDEDSGRTIKKIVFTIQARPKKTTNVPEDQKDQFLEEVRKVMRETKDLAQSVRDDADAGVFDGEQGPKGDAGSVHFLVVNALPEENIDESAIYLVPITLKGENNEYAEYIYVNGHWEYIGSATVEVDLDDYVKKDDYATSSVGGVVKVNEGFGIGARADGTLYPVMAQTTDIDAKTNSVKNIPPNLIDYAVMKALSDSKLEWTAEQKQLARVLLGSVGSGDYAGVNKSGVVKVFGDDFGWIVNSLGYGMISQATEKDIDEKSKEKKPITPKLLDYAVKKALSDCKLEGADVWTDEEKAKALELLGGVASSLVSHPAKNGTIVLRGATGAIFIGEPTSNSHATTKKYVDDGFVSKIATTTPSVYMANSNGDTELRVLSASAIANSIVARDGDGRIYAVAPKYDSQVTTKKYVDDLVAELRAEIEALKA